VVHSTEDNTSDSSSSRSIWCVSACTKPDASEGQSVPAAVAALLVAHSGKYRLKFWRVCYVKYNYTRDQLFLICKIEFSTAFGNDWLTQWWFCTFSQSVIWLIFKPHVNLVIRFSPFRLNVSGAFLLWGDDFVHFTPQDFDGTSFSCHATLGVIYRSYIYSQPSQDTSTGCTQFITLSTRCRCWNASASGELLLRPLPRLLRYTPLGISVTQHWYPETFSCVVFRWIWTLASLRFEYSS